MADQVEYHIATPQQRKTNLTWEWTIKFIRTVWTVSRSIAFPGKRDARLVPALKFIARTSWG
jgi:hypothetical protein